MGAGVSGSMREARGSLMLIEERLGVHIPRELNTLIAQIPGLAAAFEALLPVVGAVFAVGVIANFVEAHAKAAKEIADGWKGIGSTFHDTMANLDDELLQARVQADNLAGHTLAAVQLQLQIINNQTLTGIIGEFKKAENEADNLLKKMDSGWFMKFLGSVDTGPAQEMLLKVREGLDAIREAGGKDETPKSVALLTKAAQDAQGEFDKLREKQREAAGVVKDSPQDKFLAAHLTDQAKAWQDVSTVLREQTIEAKERFKTAEVKESNVTTEEAKKTEGAWDKAFAGLVKRIGDARTKAQESAASISEAQIKATEAVSKLGSHDALDSNLNKTNQAALVSGYQISLGKQKDALDSAHALGLLSEAAYYEDLKRIYQQEHAAKMQSLQIEMEQTEEPDKKLRIQQQMTAETIRFNSELSKSDTSAAKFASSWKSYFAEMDTAQKQFARNMRVELQGSIRDVSQGFSSGFAKMIVEGKSLGASMQQVAGQVAEHWIESLMKQMIAHEMTTAAHIVGNQAMAVSDKTTSAMSQLAAAKAGAAKAFQAMAGIPIVGPALGAVAAVGAFSLMMAFEKGGIVPGVTVGDTVPAMLTPGEAVLPKALTEHLTNAAKFGKSDGDSGHTHFHHHASYTIHAIDGPSVQTMLTKHADTFQAHFHSQVRRMNKR
jgi:hypothetical protein